MILTCIRCCPLTVAAVSAYFHGVTKPELLQVFDPWLSVTCSKAIAQMGQLQKFDRIAANSRSSADTLVAQFDSNGSCDTKDIHVIPPRLLTAFAFEEEGRKERPGTRILYVGRIKSHKKIEHILELFSAYLDLDKEAELRIVGDGNDKAYMDYLMWVQSSRLHLPDHSVKWLGSVDEDELDRQYREASVYISMSEDEGYCLPGTRSYACERSCFCLWTASDQGDFARQWNVVLGKRFCVFGQRKFMPS